MSAVEVLEPGARTLGELAEIANREHEATLMALGSAIHAAIRCGEALLDAYRIVPRSEWSAWLGENVSFVRSLAHQYMRLANYKSHLPREVFEPWTRGDGRHFQPSVSRAMKYVAGLPPLAPFHKPLVGEEIKREIRRLRRTGLSYKNIGAMLGVSKRTAYVVCNPTSAVERNNRRLRAKAARRALREQERRKARDNAAKAAGGSLKETYSLIRRAVDEAQRAFDVATEPEIRAAVNETMTKLHQAEDAISRANLAAETLAQRKAS